MKPVIRLVKNDDYEEGMGEIGRRIYERMTPGRWASVSILLNTKDSQFPYSYPYQPVHETGPDPIYTYAPFHKLWTRLKLHSLFFPTRRRPLNPHSHHSHSRNKKSLDDPSEFRTTPEAMAEWEYAIERRILEAPELEMVYYTDAVGDVPFPDDDETDLGGAGGERWGM